MYSYRAFGLRIQSELELPELSPDELGGACDVNVRFQALGIIESAPKAYHRYSSSQQVMCYPGVGAFVINGLDEIVVEQAPGNLPSLLALPLLGPVMGLLLHLRGRFVLHASAVVLGDAGVGFLGDKGAGKSTLAAMILRERAASLLTDDLLVFDGQGAILAAFPQIKLEPQALAVLQNLDARLRPPPAESFPKLQLRLASESIQTPVVAHTLYELRRHSEARIEPLTTPEAMRTLIRFSYASRFADRSLDAPERRRLFQQAAQIVNVVRVKRLYVPDSLERLSLAGDMLSTHHGDQSPT